MKVLFCAGMSRSGGTRQYQIAAEVVKHLQLGRGAGFGQGLPDGKFDKEDGWLVCKREMPEYWMPGMCELAIGIHRDPRDVVCSFMRWRGEQGRYDDFDSALEETITAVNWFAQWETIYNYIARYEGFNAAEEAQKIASLLGHRLPDKEAQKIAGMYTAEENIKRQEHIKSQGQWMNPSIMLTAAHVGSGHGRSVWRETLTDLQVKRVQIELGFWMETHGYVCHLDSVG